MFALDVGLLGAVANLAMDVVVRGNAVFEEFKVNARSKSCISYARQFSPSQVARASLLNLKADGDTVNIPLYLLPALSRLLKQAA